MGIIWESMDWVYLKPISGQRSQRLHHDDHGYPIGACLHINGICEAACCGSTLW